MAGLASFPGAWFAGPAAALVALLCYRYARLVSVAGAALAAGSVWGSAARLDHDRDCRTLWRSGDRIELVVAPRGLPAPGRTQRMTIVSPGCGGAITVTFPAPDSVVATHAVVGTWVRDMDRAARRWRKPARLGRLVVRHDRVLGPVACPSADCFRIGAERRLVRLFGPRRAALAAALTVDAEAAIPRAERERFTRAGLAHLLSISGFHVALLAAALLVVLRAVRLPPDPARLLATVAVALYVAFLGANAPALRAGLAIALWWWARRRQRPPSAAALLAVCALAVMVADPFALFEAGPWLSFSGVWGCVAASRLWSRVTSGASRKRRPWLRLLAPVAVSAGACLATAPITIGVFGVATPAALAANIAAVPLAALAVPVIAVALLLSVLPFGAAAAGVAAAAAGLALDLLDHVAVIAARLPYANIALSGWLAAITTALAAWLLLRALPPRSRRAPSQALLARAALAVALLVAAPQVPALAGSGSSDADGRLALHFLAVGQGDATLIRTPRGRWIAIDGGPRVAGMDAGARRVVPFLRRHGVRRLALVIASHGDADHLGGLPAVLRAVPADLVLEPGEALGRPLYRDWLAGVARRGARWHAARAGERLDIDGVTLRIWHPDSAWMTRRESANENSVVVSVEYGGFRALFPGDAGLPMEAERAGAIGDVSLLKVGHHGSRSATGDAWLAALRPEHCVVSVGRNRYGHPHPVVLAALLRSRCRIARTDSGDVRVTTDGRTIIMNSEEQE